MSTFKITFTNNIELTYSLIDAEVVELWKTLIVTQTVNDLCRKSGLTVLLVEQNANTALAVADYGVLLSLGKVVANLPAAELKADASLRAAYLGY